MLKGNDTISSVIKGTNKISKILFNNDVVWEKSQQPTILDLEKGSVRVDLGKRYVNPNLSLQAAGTYNTYWLEIPKDRNVLTINASGVLTSANGVRCAYTNDYTSDIADELFQFGYNKSDPTIALNKNYKYVAISIFKTSLPATYEFN